MYIQVSEIPPEGIAVPRGGAPGDQVDFAGRDVSPLTGLNVLWLEFQITLSGKDIVLAGKWGGSISYTCDRCGEDVTMDLDLDFHKIFVGGREMSPGRDTELKREDLDIAHLNGDGFFLEDVIYEQLILSIPYQKLCRGDCRGLCQVCGTNLNGPRCSCLVGEVDPRLEILKTLRDTME